MVLYWYTVLYMVLYGYGSVRTLYCAHDTVRTYIVLYLPIWYCTYLMLYGHGTVQNHVLYHKLDLLLQICGLLSYAALAPPGFFHGDRDFDNWRHKRRAVQMSPVPKQITSVSIAVNQEPFAVS